MKKKIICTLLSALMLLSSPLALASSEIPVSVDRRTIYFSDQQPEIINDRTMIPLRGVFEALGAKVQWNGEERKVTVFSKDNLTRLIFYIDSTDFKQIVFNSILSYEVKEFKSEVAPVIRNGRTMIPLYLVADYMGNKAEWNAQERSVTVTSKERLKLLDSITISDDITAEEILNKTLPALSISSDKTDVTAGDEVTVTLNLSNVSGIDTMEYFGTTASIIYDMDNFEFKSCNYIIDHEESAKACNPVYMGNSVKYIYLHNPNALPALNDCSLVEFVFVAKNDNGGTFKLSDRMFDGEYDTTLIVHNESEDKVLSKADELYIDTTPVVLK